MNTSPSPAGRSPCLHHIVMWKLKDPDQAPQFRELLLSCAELVPGMLAFDVGIRQADHEANVDVVLTSRFADAAALNAYATHPHHQTVAARLGLMREQRHVLDYWA